MSQRQFSKEFKMQVVNLVLKDGIEVSVVAEKFNLHLVMVYRWIQEYKEQGDDAFVGKGRQHAADKKLRKLLKENKRLKMKNKILKKQRHTLRNIRQKTRLCQNKPERI